MARRRLGEKFSEAIFGALDAWTMSRQWKQKEDELARQQLQLEYQQPLWEAQAEAALADAETARRKNLFFNRINERLIREQPAVVDDRATAWESAAPSIIYPNVLDLPEDLRSLAIRLRREEESRRTRRPSEVVPISGVIPGLPDIPSDKSVDPLLTTPLLPTLPGAGMIDVTPQRGVISGLPTSPLPGLLERPLQPPRVSRQVAPSRPDVDGWVWGGQEAPSRPAVSPQPGGVKFREPTRIDSRPLGPPVSRWHDDPDEGWIFREEPAPTLPITPRIMALLPTPTPQPVPAAVTADQRPADPRRRITDPDYKFTSQIDAAGTLSEQTQQPEYDFSSLPKYPPNRLEALEFEGAGLDPRHYVYPVGQSPRELLRLGLLQGQVESSQDQKDQLAKSLWEASLGEGRYYQETRMGPEGKNINVFGAANARMRALARGDWDENDRQAYEDFTRSVLDAGAQERMDSALQSIRTMSRSLPKLRVMVERYRNGRDPFAEGMVGPISGRWSNFLTSLPKDWGMTDTVYSQLVAELRLIESETIKGFAGAAVSEQEAERLSKFIPTENDNLPVLMAKFQIVLQMHEDMYFAIGWGITLENYYDSGFSDRITNEDLDLLTKSFLSDPDAGVREFNLPGR